MSGAGAGGVAARVAAARVLDAVLHRGRSLKAELATVLPAFDDARDRALVEAIVFAALRQRTRYDAALSAWIAKPLGRRDGELRALLLAGLAQLDDMQLSAHAALDATVEAARALGRTHQAGMVNALLRRAQREGVPAATTSPWPEWLLRQLRADWPEQVDAILAASAQAAPLWLRVNRARAACEAYREQLLQAGIHAQPHPALGQALRVDVPVAVAALPGFDAGVVSVQDGSAQLVAEALAPPGGARVLDACAAPGGKAAHLLERDPSLRVLALDVDARRVRRMADTFSRLGVMADARAADATDPAQWWDGAPFDAVVIDAPCSATGIVRRQPDILLHRRESDLAALQARQARLLDALWPVLAPGGVLLYATCSILKAENEHQVAGFLARTPDARIEPLDARFGHAFPGGSQRLPGEDGMDGFFYARLRKAG